MQGSHLTTACSPLPGGLNRGPPVLRRARRLQHILPLAGLLLALAACDGAPSRNILGSYFPSWMVCALIGSVVALLARAVLKATGLLEELPAPLVVLLALGCAVTFGLWLLWLA
jgi:hypothetical protein